MKTRRKFKIIIFITAGLAIIFIFLFSLPRKLFTDPYATTLNDSGGNLLGAVIAGDGQWRFPPVDQVPEKLRICVIQFEDRYFYRHPGFNPGALARAAWMNIKAGKIISGGSTITMQVIRIHRKNRPRTYFEKILEIVLSLRLELRSTKEEILSMYISHAPYGSNIVGVSAASWRYFSRGPGDLSWSESALLAVLPNQPGLIFPGRNLELLGKKRDRLLARLLEKGVIDSLTYALSVSEPVPSAPGPLPALAPQLLTRAINEGMTGRQIITTIDHELQNSAAIILERHANGFRSRQVYNAAAIIMQVNTGRVLAYLGNTQPSPGYDGDHGNDVDIVKSPRSTGSILKPLLYAAMADEGILLPGMLVPDIPTVIDGFAPKNFSMTFDGAVQASDVVARSLNVPAVYLLQNFSYEKFHYVLSRLGLTTLNRPPDHYGLSLILGGAETTLWDICGVYASLARELNDYFQLPASAKYNSADIHPPVIYPENETQIPALGDRGSGIINAGPVWMMLDIMTELARPGEDASWRYYASGRRIAWKTGTSFGNRDAWSIGLDRNYLVGVWVGNADGEGRPGLTGAEFAAPLMFDLFNLVARGPWFETPGSDLKEILTCRKSGFRASVNCEDTLMIKASLNALKSPLCSYCKLIFLDPSGRVQVNADCESSGNMIRKSWFVLPPVQEWYFKNRDPFYRVLPPFRKDCISGSPIPAMSLIYPRDYARIFVPRELIGEMGKTVFEVAHRHPGTTVFWHIDNQYAGMTKNIHQLGLSPSEGDHILVLVDEHGEYLKIRFRIISGNQP